MSQDQQSTPRNLPTLADVASRAAVSTATVSRCLNEPDKVSNKTRTRVMEAIEALNYTPNFGARAIAANRTGIYGAVIPTMENAIFARGIEAFQRRLLDQNATMLVASSSFDPALESRLIRTMVARGADGILLVGTDRDPEIYAFLHNRNIPWVIAWNIANATDHSYVGFDNRLASQKLVTHAIGLGHHRFAYISAPVEQNDRARERVLGAKQAINGAGLDANAMEHIETGYSVENGFRAFNQLQAPFPTLVICGNDVLAVGAIQAAQTRGLRVPQDISIVGFDNIELASVVRPGLTTVGVPHRDMGEQSAEVLLALVREPDKPIRRTLLTNIVERDSLAQAREGQ